MAGVYFDAVREPVKRVDIGMAGDRLNIGELSAMANGNAPPE